MTLFIRFIKLPIILTLILITALFSAIIFGGGCCIHQIAGRIETITMSDEARLAAELQKHSLSIHRIDKEGERQFVGSGSYIEYEGKPHVLTAYHVWEYTIDNDNDDGEECIPVCYRKDCSCVTELSESESAHSEDWALIELPAEFAGATYALLGNANSLEPIGEPIFITGNPNGKHLYLFGHIAGYSTLPSEPFTHYTLQTYGYYGASGGGVYNSDGELIGVLEAIAMRVTNALGFPIPIEDPNIVYVVPIVEIEELFERRRVRDIFIDFPI